MSNKQSRRRASGRITLADVARVADVSPITVSRALRGERAVAPELVERVKAAAGRLGYVPDPAARALASRTGSHVAVLVPLLSNALFVDLIEAAQGVLRAAGFQMLIGITNYSDSEEEQLLREQLPHRPAGLIVTGLQQNKATRAMIESSGIPCVHAMETTDQPGVHAVGFSQVEAGAALTRHLLERGRRRIAFAAAQLDPRTMSRRAGWRREMQAAGLYSPSLEWLNAAPSSPGLGAAMLEQVASVQPAVDAIFFNNDDLAQGALLAALRLGLAVPQRLAIVGFNDLTGSDQMVPPLTTVRTPRRQVGEAAAQMLLTLLRGGVPASPCVDVGFELVVRASS